MAEAEVLALIMQHNKPFNASEWGQEGGHAARGSGPPARSTAHTAAQAAASPHRCAHAPLPSVGVGDFLATKGIKKAAVQRALDNLAADGRLVAKASTGGGRGGQAMHTNTMHVTWPRVESRMRLAPRMRMHACMQRAKEQAAHCGGSGPHACMQAGRHGCHARAQLAAAGAGPRVQMLPLTCRRAFNPVPPGIRQDQDLPAAPGRTGGALKGGEAAGCRSCDLTQL